MGTFTVGSVVLVQFPFSDLSGSKLRPAIILAYSGNNDWVLCQITSNQYADGMAICITDTEFESGGLFRTSYIRPGKIFTANVLIFIRSVGTLKKSIQSVLVDKVVSLIRNQG